MKDGTKNILSTCILAIGLFIVVFVYTYANRYEIIVTPEAGMFKVDKWSGTATQITWAK